LRLTMQTNNTTKITCQAVTDAHNRMGKHYCYGIMWLRHTCQEC
jgi:hypothetical protein